MFAVELKFQAKVRGAPDDKTDAITWLTAALVRNGNLLKDFLLKGESEEWTVYGIAPAQDAFQKANWNRFVRQRVEGLSSANLKRPRIKFLGTMPETSPACQCAKPSGFFLFTTFLHIEPPVWCIDCHGIFPLYRLPRAKNGEHNGLLLWESNYKACDTLQLNSAVGERFGTRQMSDPASELSRSGLAVCKEIQHLAGRPVYYYLHRSTGRSAAAEALRMCPICRDRWRLEKPLFGKFEFKCDRCRLLSNMACNVR